MAEFGTGLRTTFVGALVACTLMSGCGDGGSSPPTSTQADAQSPTVPDPAASSAAAPVVSVDASSSLRAAPLALALEGAPADTVPAGTAYHFVPTLTHSDPGVGFSVENKPAWASFNTVTGELSGTPTEGDAGTYDSIVITANAAGASVSLPAFSITVKGPTPSTVTGAATLSWNPPTQYQDGRAIENLAGYNIYFGSSEDELTGKIQVTNPGLTAYTVSDLGAGTHYFGITAYTTAGVESDLMLAGSKTIM